MNVSSIGVTPIPASPTGSEAQVRNANDNTNSRVTAAAPTQVPADQRADRPGQVVDKKV